MPRLQMINWNSKQGINKILPENPDLSLILIIRPKKDKIKYWRKK
jgi:hypothetical protein